MGRGVVSPFPDVYNVFIVLKNANKKDAIMVLFQAQMVIGTLQ